MARKRNQGGGDSEGSWLNTYADMVTLLMTFFIVLLSMSSTDEATFNAFVKSFSNLPQETQEEVLGNNELYDENATDISVTGSMEDLYLSLKEYVKENGHENDVDLSKVDDIIYVKFNSALFFEPNKYTLLTSSIPTLTFVGDALNAHEDQIRMVHIMGFTATVDIENIDYWRLSAARAAEVAAYFDGQTDFAPEKMTVMGFGNLYPVAPSDTEQGRKKNRRVELIIVGNDSDDDFNIFDTLNSPDRYQADA